MEINKILCAKMANGYFATYLVLKIWGDRSTAVGITNPQVEIGLTVLTKTGFGAKAYLPNEFLKVLIKFMNAHMCRI